MPLTVFFWYCRVSNIFNLFFLKKNYHGNIVKNQLEHHKGLN